MSSQVNNSLNIIKMNKKEKLDPGVWVGLALIIVLCLCTSKCNAQRQTAHVDTIACHSECINKFTTTTTAKGTVKVYAVYNCKHNGISDLIPVSKTVWEYITLCRQNGIKPNLGIRLRNGQISSIIKYKPKYKVR